MRLIDADELNKTLGIDSDSCSTCSWGYRGRCSRGCDFEDACCAIEDAPTIDAVPVVRCCNCEHWHLEEGGVLGHCRKHDFWSSESWFCADPERRKNETAD